MTCLLKKHKLLIQSSWGSVSQTGPIDNISTLRISILKYFMLDDSKRLDQNDLYNRNLRARERDDTSRETCSESTCSDFILYIFKTFFVIFGEVQY